MADTYVLIDLTNKGNLKSCIDNFEYALRISDEKEYVWFLQDDVILSSRFAEITQELEKYDYPVICGFASCYDCDEDDDKEYTYPKKMWYSFPCMRIQNWVLKEFLEWYKNNQEKLKKYIEENKYDDTIFKQFLEEEHSNMRIKLIIPNLVDHIDYLLGGSITNPGREIRVRSKYWNENSLVEELERKLNSAC